MMVFPACPSWIIVHCSATDDGPASDWLAIRRYHVEVLGWEEIGYHFLVERVGDAVRWIAGRHPRFVGAHCKAGGRNRDSLGVCLVGNFDRHPPDGPILGAGAKLVAHLAFFYGIPLHRIARHSDFEKAKTCPGKLFPWTLFLEYVETFWNEFSGNQPSP
jgi:N-acetyl-anhydromuramyl-L-alanine amidase AmpD